MGIGKENSDSTGPLQANAEPTQFPSFSQIASEAKRIERNAIPSVRHNLDFEKPGEAIVGSTDDMFEQYTFFETSIQARQIDRSVPLGKPGHKISLQRLKAKTTPISPEASQLHEFAQAQGGEKHVQEKKKKEKKFSFKSPFSFLFGKKKEKQKEQKSAAVSPVPVQTQAQEHMAQQEQVPAQEFATPPAQQKQTIPTPTQQIPTQEFATPPAQQKQNLPSPEHATAQQKQTQEFTSPPQPQQQPKPEGISPNIQSQMEIPPTPPTLQTSQEHEDATVPAAGEIPGDLDEQLEKQVGSLLSKPDDVEEGPANAIIEETHGTNDTASQEHGEEENEPILSMQHEPDLQDMFAGAPIIKPISSFGGEKTQKQRKGKVGKETQRKKAEKETQRKKAEKEKPAQASKPPDVPLESKKAGAKEKPVSAKEVPSTPAQRLIKKFRSMPSLSPTMKKPEKPTTMPKLIEQPQTKPKPPTKPKINEQPQTKPTSMHESSADEKEQKVRKFDIKKSLKAIRGLRGELPQEPEPQKKRQKMPVSPKRIFPTPKPRPTAEVPEPKKQEIKKPKKVKTIGVKKGKRVFPTRISAGKKAVQQPEAPGKKPAQRQLEKAKAQMPENAKVQEDVGEIHSGMVDSTPPPPPPVLGAKKGGKKREQAAKMIADEIYFAYARDKLTWLYEIYKIGGMTLDEFREQVKRRMEADSGRYAHDSVDSGKNSDNPALHNLNKEIKKKFKK